MTLRGYINIAIVLLIALAIGLTFRSVYKRGAASRDAEVTQLKAERGAFESDATAWEQDSILAKNELKQCKNNWATAERTLDEQAQAALAAVQAAELEAKKWKDKWDTRPQSCKAALAALDAQCSMLEGY